MKKRLLVSLALLLLFCTAPSLIATCLCMTIWIPAFTSQETHIVCSYNLSEPTTAAANTVSNIAEQQGVKLDAPESATEVVLTLDKNGNYHGSIFISYVNSSLADDSVYYSADGSRFERYGEWVITPDRQLWYLNSQTCLDKIAAIEDGSPGLTINGIQAYAEWGPFALSNSAEDVGLYYQPQIIERLVKWDWFLKLRIFMIEHRIPNRALVKLRWYVYLFSGVVSVVLIIGNSFWRRADRKRAPHVERMSS